MRPFPRFRAVVLITLLPSLPSRLVTMQSQAKTTPARLRSKGRLMAAKSKRDGRRVASPNLIADGTSNSRPRCARRGGTSSMQCTPSDA